MPRSHLIPATAALCLLGLLCPALSAGESGLEAAVAAFQSGRYEEAVGHCDAVAPDSPNGPRALYLKGYSLLLLGRPEEAKASFEAALESRPESAPVLTGLGKALSALERHEAAVDTLRRAVKADSRDQAAQRSLGEALLAAGKGKAATKALAKAWKLDKKDSLTCRAFVEGLLASENPGEARSVAAKLRKARPKHPMGHFLLGLVLDREGKAEEAIAAYEQAIALDDTFLDAHKNLAILCHTMNPLYRDRERTRKALHHYEKYFTLGGQDEELERIYRQMKGFLESMSGR